MATSFPAAMNATFVFPATQREQVSCSAIYEEHCHRIYSLAFWMTGNELMAEDLTTNTFLRIFSGAQTTTADHIDRAFLSEVRELCAVGTLTLHPSLEPDAPRIYGNIKRIHLEHAVLELPATEKLVFLLHDVEGYSHQKIARLIGMTEEECQLALHQARLRIRQLVAEQC